MKKDVQLVKIKYHHSEDIIRILATVSSITQRFKGRKGEKLDKKYYCFKTNSKTY